MSKYGVISGPYFPVFSPNTRKYGPEIIPYFDTFHAVQVFTSETTVPKLLKSNPDAQLVRVGRGGRSPTLF